MRSMPCSMPLLYVVCINELIQCSHCCSGSMAFHMLSGDTAPYYHRVPLASSLLMPNSL